MKAQVVVNKHNVAFNRANPDQEPRPVLSIQTSKGVIYLKFEIVAASEAFGGEGVKQFMTSKGEK